MHLSATSKLLLFRRRFVPCYDREGCFGVGIILTQHSEQVIVQMTPKTIQRPGMPCRVSPARDVPVAITTGQFCDYVPRRTQSTNGHVQLTWVIVNVYNNYCLQLFDLSP
jgi:hypothetical protein